MKITSAETTSVHLSNYIGEVLKTNQLDAKFCAYCLEANFGNEIHKMINGFINFSKENNISNDDIMVTLCHDLGGALRQDQMMMPRVSEYSRHSN